MSEDKTGFEQFYDNYYKALLLIPLLLFLISGILIGTKYAQEGEFINRGISFSGGLGITIENTDLSGEEIQDQLRQEFPEYDINFRLLGGDTNQRDVIIESNIQPENEDSDRFEQELLDITGLTNDDISVERIGAAFGDAFFKQMFIALLVAFLFMATVVFFYFRAFEPSMAVILAAVFNILVAVAIVNMLGLQLGTAGVAGLLMLIGYSIDTDILLTTRMLKEKRERVNLRIKDAITTGVTMTASSFIALLIAYIMVSSEVLQEIMLVVMLGLAADLISTYVQNAGLLKWYLERTGASE